MSKNTVTCPLTIWHLPLKWCEFAFKYFERQLGMSSIILQITRKQTFCLTWRSNSNTKIPKNQKSGKVALLPGKFRDIECSTLATALESPPNKPCSQSSKHQAADGSNDIQLPRSINSIRWQQCLGRDK